MDDGTKSERGAARLERLLASPAGERLARSLEESAAQVEAAVARRRQAAESLAEARRRRSEEVPVLAREHGNARAAMDDARRAYKDAIRALGAVGRRVDRLQVELNDAEARARRELERTADPRVREALSRVEEALADRRLFSPETDSTEVLVDPDPSDPNHRSFIAQGRKYRLTRRGSNAQGLIAIRSRLEEARKELRALLLEVEVPADLGARLARFGALCAWTPPPLDWQDPAPPRFDSRGGQVA